MYGVQVFTVWGYRDVPGCIGFTLQDVSMCVGSWTSGLGFGMFRGV